MATSKKSRTDASGKLGAFAAGAVVAAAVAGYFLYGPKGAQNRKKIEAWSVKAKGEVLSKLEDAKEISEEKYHQIVDAVTEKYSKVKNVGEDKANDLNKELKRHWSKVKKEMNKKVGGAKSKSDSIRKKIAKKIEPKEKA